MKPNLVLTSTLRPDGAVEIALTESAVPIPAAHEIVVEMTAAPLHPADQSLLFARADPATAEQAMRDGRPVTILRAPAPSAAAQRTRWDLAMPVGMEGAGRVVAAGADAQDMVGRLVAVWGGGSYARYKTVAAVGALLLPEGVTAVEGAAAFINPLTALGMIETMRDEGFSALVHTAAASTLGQMLCRLCQQDGIGLVNIVRRPEQIELLRAIGAEHICDSGSDSFTDDLVAAIRATGATLGFDATGGGTLASQILHAMEQAIVPNPGYQHYGSSIRKKVLIYGTLDASPLQLLRNYGLAWDLGGWLVFHFLERIGPERLEALKQRIAAELKTSFVLSYSHVISLEQACDPDILRAAARRATGEKYLIDASL